MQADGETDAATLAGQLVEHLNGRRVACAESCTAGQVCAELASVGGASEWLQGGLVAYRVATKRKLLGVSAPSVFTEQAAGEMAAGVGRLLDADVAVSTTGVLGDEPEDGAAPGTVIVGTLVDGDVRAVTCHVGGCAPDERCAAAVATALRLLLEHLRAPGAARTATG
jgi:nicotinamide-nucleotide amidase